MLSACAVVAQTAEPAASPTPRGSGTSGLPNAVPVSWRQYSSSQDNFSAVFPKLPVALRSGTGGCTTIARANFFAYAEEAVYEVSITSKSKVDAPRDCLTVERYGKELFGQRLSELRVTMTSADQTIVDGQKAVVLVSASQTRWFVNDPDNDRWLELAIHHRPTTTVDPERFLHGMSLRSGSGIEIGEGSAVTLGDDFVREPPKGPDQAPQIPQGTSSGNSDGGKTELPVITGTNLTIIGKARPGYTDVARDADVQGTVRLRVTFYSNGSTGSISAISGLPYGLTEQAIKAAQRIVFIPKTVNGYPVSVTKVVEYSFSIY